MSDYNTGKRRGTMPFLPVRAKIFLFRHEKKQESFLPCFFLSLSSALLTQQREGREVFVRDGICGTETPSAALKDAHKRLASTKDSQRVANTDGKPKNIEVKTYFHVVSTKDQVDLVTNEMIASQVCLTACILLYSQANKQPVCLPRTRICQYKHQL